MTVLFAASECAPLAKVGGLGDVIGALPKELERLGESVSIALPLYDHLLKHKLTQEIISDKDGNKFFVHFLGEEQECRLFSTILPGSAVPVYLIQNLTYLTNGNIYLSPSAIASGDDELRRFMFFSKAVYTLFERGFFRFDVVHAHDYHTSYLLYLFKNEKALGTKPRLILTVHNTENQGKIVGEDLNLETNGRPEAHNLLGMGIASADKIVPVSKYYTVELLEGKYCFGLESVIRAFSDRIIGIVNGLDQGIYNPATDAALSERYDDQSFQRGKFRNKQSLLTDYGLAVENIEMHFVVSFVGRLAHQKNIKLIYDSVFRILHNEKNREHLSFVFLGVGDPDNEELLRTLAGSFPKNVVFVNTFDESLAHRIFAASDLFLIPSEFEPCGLTQLIAMKYGALPLATAVGGLVDTISVGQEKQTGFFIRTIDPDYLSVQILDLFTYWKNAREDWDKIVTRAMTQDFSWEESAKRYIELYRGYGSLFDGVNSSDFLKS